MYRNRDTGLYGILAPDGSYDSGAVYYNVKATGDYFQITLTRPEDPDNMDQLNNTGLVDGYGNVIIPTEYATLEAYAGSPFVKAIKATARTENKDEAILYLSSSYFSLSASDTDPLYVGEWEVYDVRTCEVVPGVAGTKNYSITLGEANITYYDDEYTSIRVNANGEQYPEDAVIYGNGAYWESATRNVYDSFGNLIFSLAETPYNSLSYSNGLYLARCYDAGETKSIVLDENGNTISIEYVGKVSLCGENLILVENRPYDFAGNLILDADVDSAYLNGKIWNLSYYETKAFYLLDTQMNLLYSGVKSDDIMYYSSQNTLGKKLEGYTYSFYSFAQGEFLYTGNSVAAGLVTVANGETKDLVDTFTDEIILSGYTAYTVCQDDNGCLYIYAQNGSDKAIYIQNQ